MQLNLKDAETYDLVRRLSEHDRKPMAQVVKDLAREEMSKRNAVRDMDVQRRLRLIAEIQGEVRDIVRQGGLSLPSNAEFDSEMYDADGLPR